MSTMKQNQDLRQTNLILLILQQENSHDTCTAMYYCSLYVKCNETAGFQALRKSQTVRTVDFTRSE